MPLKITSEAFEFTPKSNIILSHTPPEHFAYPLLVLFRPGRFSQAYATICHGFSQFKLDPLTKQEALH